MNPTLTRLNCSSHSCHQRSYAQTFVHIGLQKPVPIRCDWQPPGLQRALQVIQDLLRHAVCSALVDSIQALLIDHHILHLGVFGTSALWISWSCQESSAVADIQKDVMEHDQSAASSSLHTCLRSRLGELQRLACAGGPTGRKGGGGKARSMPAGETAPRLLRSHRRSAGAADRPRTSPRVVH